MYILIVYVTGGRLSNVQEIYRNEENIITH